MLNHGNNVSYSGNEERIPPPRAAMIGYTISIGASIHSKQESFNLINFSFSSEVNDPSIASDNSAGDVVWVNKSPFSDVRLFNNLIEMNYDDNVVVHRGQILSILETLTIASGSFNGMYGGYEGNKSVTYQISLSGLFKLLAYLNNKYTTRYISRHFELNFYLVRSPNSTNFLNFSVMLKGG